MELVYRKEKERYAIMYFNKLVRDRIPEIIKAQGEEPHFEILSDSDYLIELNKKLNEEVAEYQESGEIEEIADILEVIHSICHAKGVLLDKVYDLKEEKREKRGSFSEKIFLVSKNERRKK